MNGKRRRIFLFEDFEVRTTANGPILCTLKARTSVELDGATCDRLIREGKAEEHKGKRLRAAEAAAAAARAAEAPSAAEETNEGIALPERVITVYRQARRK